MPLSDAEQQYLENARVGRLATANAEGHPHVVPICFTVTDDGIVTPIDKKPKDVAPTDLRRVRDIRTNPQVALVVDHYAEDWDALGWVQVRGTAFELSQNKPAHDQAVRALRTKYDQYAAHALEERPIIRIKPAHSVSWGQLERATP